MKPTLAQRLFASPWPWRVICGIFMLAFTVPKLQSAKLVSLRLLLESWPLSLLLIGTGCGMGLVLGKVLALFLLRPFLRWRAARNGAPFVKGDVVQIIRGAHAGTQATVISLRGKNDQVVEVDLGEAPKADHSSLFSPLQIMRVPNGVPDMIVQNPQSF